MTLKQALSVARGTMTRHSIEAAHLESEMLMMHVLGVSRAKLYASLEDELAADDEKRFRSLLERRLKGEPAAYITGTREFYGLEFQVDRRVLIPRPESEMLVEAAIELAEEGFTLFADVGTGSGALAVSLAVNLPEAIVYALDISCEALEVAAINANRHGVADRVHLMHGNLLEPLPEPVDVIVANLPYVRTGDLPAVNTDGFEPRLALDGGEDGLDVIRRLVGQVISGRARGRSLLREAGALLLEIGIDEDQFVLDLLEHSFPASRVSVREDLAGIPRVVTVRF